MTRHQRNLAHARATGRPGDARPVNAEWWASDDRAALDAAWYKLCGRRCPLDIEHDRDERAAIQEG